MVFISHDIQTERYISDRIVVMNHGQIMEEGPAKQVFEDPQDAYTQDAPRRGPVPAAPQPRPVATHLPAGASGTRARPHA